MQRVSSCRSFTWNCIEASHQGQSLPDTTLVLSSWEPIDTLQNVLYFPRRKEILAYAYEHRHRQSRTAVLRHINIYIFFFALSVSNFMHYTLPWSHSKDSAFILPHPDSSAKLLKLDYHKIQILWYNCISQRY